MALSDVQRKTWLRNSLKWRLQKRLDWLLDEDDFSVAFIRVSHVDSDNEAPSDVESSEDKNQQMKVEKKTIAAEKMRSVTTRIWFGHPQDRNFNKRVVVTIEMENSSCLNYARPW